MSVTIDTMRSAFYQELSPEKQQEYFNLKRSKTMHMIDNLYYTVFIKDDDATHPHIGVQFLLDELEEYKDEAIKIRDPLEFGHGLYYLLKSYSSYSYCTGNPDMYTFLDKN